MLNSSYGKTIEGIHDMEEKILDSKEFIDYIYKN